MKQIETNLSLKVAKNHHCEICDYTTSKVTDYKKHLETIKHKSRQNETNETNLSLKVAENLCCKCGIQFSSRTTLWRHRKKCNSNTTFNEIGLTDKEFMNILIKQNEKLMNIVENGTNNTNSSVINSHNNYNNNNTNNTNNIENKTFNLQFFLNETCKDAMNISEFVSSIKPKLADLENTGRVGYVEGISNIILKNLNNLEEHFRPLHCSDPKREVIYIKNNNEWTKETDDKSILTKAIKVIANENIKNISEWRKEYPDCTDSDSVKNDLYLKIVSNSMCGSTKEETNKNISKIITNVAKGVTINKD